MNKLILLAPFLLLMLMGIAGATTPTLPSGIQYYVPINITNSQTTATSAPFQQMMTVNALNYTSYITFNGVSANFEYFYANGTIIPAWIESNVSNSITTWAKTIAIPASSHIQIYLGFASKTTNLLSSSGTSGIGEAPQLPCGTTATSSCSTYAQYDDGASVFTNYWNFAGTSLPTGWTAYGTAYSIDNGLSLSGTSTTILSTTSTYPINNIQESYVDTTTLGDGMYNGYYLSDGGGQYNIVSAGIYLIGTTTGYWYNGVGTGIVSSTAVSLLNGVHANSEVYTATGYQIIGTYATSTESYFQQNYNNVLTETTDIPAQGNYYIETGSSGAVFTTYWLRTRAYPPSGVMPSVSFGAVQAHVSLSISPNPATYGQSVNITATCNPTDTCAIDYPSLGTAIATGTGSATYTYNAFALGAGTYSSFYANDITQGTNSTPVTLTVNKAPVSPSCSFAGASIANDTTQQSFAAQNYLNCTMPNHNSQLTVNLYYNGSIVTSGNTISYLTKFDNYNNSFTYNTIGNTNYTAGSFIGQLR